jgi:hypothetical protein
MKERPETQLVVRADRDMKKCNSPLNIAFYKIVCIARGMFRWMLSRGCNGAP